jgi:hypothetical protein
MIKRALMGAAAIFVVACNSGPNSGPAPGSAQNTVGGANVVSSTQAPMAPATSSLSLDWGAKGQAGQVAIADVISYGGPKITITPPTGWQLIRDDSTPTTRQSLYWHAIQANDSSTAAWTFSEPVDAQGAIVLLDNVASAAPVDMTSGNTGNGGTATAKSMATTADGAAILYFFSTDFANAGLGPTIPSNVNTIVNQKSPREYWILSNYQSQNGNTEDAESSTGQIFNWVAAQAAIKRAEASATSATSAASATP